MDGKQKLYNNFSCEVEDDECCSVVVVVITVLCNIL